MLESIKPFLNKKVRVKGYLDYNYRIAGDPQYRLICYINNRLVYDDRSSNNEITRSVVKDLINYALSTRRLERSVNYYGLYEYDGWFYVVEN